jgi:hypothetical protein
MVDHSEQELFGSGIREVAEEFLWEQETALQLLLLLQQPISFVLKALAIQPLVSPAQ